MSHMSRAGGALAFSSKRFSRLLYLCAGLWISVGLCSSTALGKERPLDRESLERRAHAIRLRIAIDRRAKSSHAARARVLTGSRDDQADLDQARAQLSIERQKAADALRDRCLSARVQDLLRPFIEPGYWQPIRWRRGEVELDLRPISLERLRACGALTPTTRGLRVLNWVAINGDDELRLRWPFRGRPWHTHRDHAVRDRLVEAQRLLGELGPTLVELGMLSD